MCSKGWFLFVVTQCCLPKNLIHFSCSGLNVNLFTAKEAYAFLLNNADLVLGREIDFYKRKSVNQLT